MGPQRRFEIYVSFDSPSIIRYHEPLTGDLFTVRFLSYKFVEMTYLTLEGEKLHPEK